MEKRGRKVKRMNFIRLNIKVKKFKNFPDRALPTMDYGPSNPSPIPPDDTHWSLGVP